MKIKYQQLCKPNGSKSLAKITLSYSQAWMKLQVMLQFNPGPRNHPFLAKDNINLKSCYHIIQTVTNFSAFNWDIYYKIGEVQSFLSPHFATMWTTMCELLCFQINTNKKLTKWTPSISQYFTSQQVFRLLAHSKMPYQEAKIHRSPTWLLLSNLTSWFSHSVSLCLPTTWST